MKALSTFDPSGTSIEDPLEQFLKSSECVVGVTSCSSAAVAVSCAIHAGTGGRE